MVSEEEMQAARIGGMRVHNAPIQLMDYSAVWPALFVRQAKRVRATLGERVLMLEHAGSTSVPGLAAKPIIDINLHVYSFGCPEIDKMLMFRDWLRSNDADRELYELRSRAARARQYYEY
jgi:GrpB-like predicted nucleotidyltransferase (UPF0157 family)